MAAGRVVGFGAVVAVAAALLLAGGARADCFDYCFKNCIAKDRSMADYCNYACDKTCGPGESLGAGAGGRGMRCQLSCARDSCSRLRASGGDDAVGACFGQCYDGCKSKTQPRPLRAGGAGAGDGALAAQGPVSEFPASEPDLSPLPAV